MDQIGTFLFVRMSRFPELVRQTKSIDRQAGQDGTGVWYHGIAGQPFDVRTVAFFDTYANALIEADDYRNLTNSAPVAVAFAGVVIANHLYDVLAVSVEDVTAVNGVLNGTQILGRVQATWKLLPHGV